MRDYEKNGPFEPGDLVHGIMLEDFPSIYKMGILPARIIGREDVSSTPDDICFGMLPKAPVTERYVRTGHKAHFSGPENRDKLGIIVSRTKIIAGYKSGRLMAIGSAFKPKDQVKFSLLYDFAPDGKSVFGIPINPETDAHYKDQVRLTVDDLYQCGIVPEYWTGITAHEEGLDDLLKLCSVHGIGLGMPVWNQRGQVMYG